MSEKLFIVQASSCSWSGGQDICLNLVNGEPVTARTVAKIFAAIPDAKVVVAAPEFDRGGALEQFKDRFQDKEFSIYYGHDDSPLRRMIEIANSSSSSHFIRVDGLHCFFDLAQSQAMLQQAIDEGLDSYLFPDDYPVQYTADVYAVKALEQIEAMIEGVEELRPFKVHPKHFMTPRAEFQTRFLADLPCYNDAYLQECRDLAVQIYREPRLKVDQDKSIASGDQLSFHYELACDYVSQEMKVLDIASGHGFGSRMLASKAAKVIGADIESEVIAIAKEQGAGVPNLSFVVDNALGTQFADAEFDLICSMETVEHVDPHPYFKEMQRLLKPGGRFILSTPQNSLGHIPVNSTHVIEYGLNELMDLCGGYFRIEKVIGIKAGRIVIEEDPVGHNTVLICRKD